MKLSTRINALGRSVASCLKCNLCTYGEWPENYPLCPLYVRDRTFTSSAGGFMYIARALLEDKMEYNSGLFPLAYSCINCRSCDDICEIIPIAPPHAHPTEIIRLLRHELVKRDFIPNGFIKEMYQTVKKNGDIGKSKIDIKIPEGMKNEDSRNILFIEGYYPKSQKQIYDSAIEVLQKIGFDVYVYSDEGSCGANLYDLGFIDELAVLLERKSQLINKMAGKNLIFIDPHTQEFVLKHWQQYVNTDKKMRGKHLIEVILNILKRSKIKKRKMEKVTISYHDPCILGRGLGIYDAPRKLIRSFEGVSLVEMKRNRRNSYCCGGGDGTRGKAFPEYSAWVARGRIEDFRETGADILITACPYCKEMFQNILRPREKTRVKDLVEFVNERIE